MMKSLPRLIAVGVLIMSTSALAGGQRYTQLINRIGTSLKVPPALIHAVIFAESNYDADAVSHAGAIGLMQLIPRFGALEAYRYLYGRNAIPSDQALARPEINVLLGTAYLRILDDEYFYWIDDDALRLRAVIAAYNWGPTAVTEQIFAGQHITSADQFEVRLEQQAPDETVAYVARVLKRLHENRQPTLIIASNKRGENQ